MYYCNTTECYNNQLSIIYHRHQYSNVILKVLLLTLFVFFLLLNNLIAIAKKIWFWLIIRVLMKMEMFFLFLFLFYFSHFKVFFYFEKKISSQIILTHANALKKIFSFFWSFEQSMHWRTLTTNTYKCNQLEYLDMKW